MENLLYTLDVLKKTYNVEILQLPQYKANYVFSKISLKYSYRNKNELAEFFKILYSNKYLIVNLEQFESKITNKGSYINSTINIYVPYKR